MIERDGEVSVKRQAQLLDLSRSSVYYVARDLPERALQLMRILDELHLKWPFYWARKLPDPGRCLLRRRRVQARGMISDAASQSPELLPLRVRLRGVGTMDEETDGRDYRQGRQIHLSRQEICPKNRSHPCSLWEKKALRSRSRS
jgi:hypothetical protein